MQKPIELAPVKESTNDYEAIERRIKLTFRAWLYEPLLAELKLPDRTIQNANDALLKAIATGRLTFSKGVFTGKLTSHVSKELRALGAKWDYSLKAYRVAEGSLPEDVAHAIELSEARFLKRLEGLDRLLAQKLPEGISGSIKLTDLFDSTLWKVDRQLKKSLQGFAVPPDLTAHMAKRIADEWQENMDLWIKDFAAEEISNLRKDIQKAAFSGHRYESVIKAIQRSYGVTSNKAKFLARQETSLLMTKFKETRYTDAGIHEYRWRCVVGSKLHPVRPSHKILDGKVFRWDSPPITSSSGDTPRRNNPGQDFNCRCSAIPIVRK